MTLLLLLNVSGLIFLGLIVPAERWSASSGIPTLTYRRKDLVLQHHHPGCGLFLCAFSSSSLSCGGQTKITEATAERILLSLSLLFCLILSSSEKMDGKWWGKKCLSFSPPFPPPPSSLSDIRVNADMSSLLTSADLSPTTLVWWCAVRSRRIPHLYSRSAALHMWKTSLLVGRDSRWCGISLLSIFSDVLSFRKNHLITTTTSPIIQL